MFALSNPGAAKEGLDQVEEAQLPLLGLQLDVRGHLGLRVDPHLLLLLRR